MSIVEIVCQSVEDALLAWEAGANRIELVAALATGGLTPSVGMVTEIKARIPGLPVMAMVRPRPGGFVHSEAEQTVMLRDATALIEAGADGLVYGALLPDQTVDGAFCRALQATAIGAGRQSVFHRAFDLTLDPFATLEELVDLGFTRILTSGQTAQVLDGAELIQALQKRAAGRIEILPGGGVRAGNAAELVERTGCDQVHLAPLQKVDDPIAKRGPVDYGGYTRVDATAVTAVVRALGAVR